MRSSAPRCLLVATIVLACSAAGSSGEIRPQIIWHRDFDIALSEAQLLDRPVLAYVTAKWCPACLRHERTTFLDKQVVKLLGESVVAIHVDADSSPELAERLGAERLPMSVLLSKEGVVIRRIEGYRPAESYLSEVAEAIRPFKRPAAASVAQHSPPPDAPGVQPSRRAPLARPDEIELATHVERSAALRSAISLTVDLTSNLMLDGNCPVSFVEAKNLAPGKPEYATEFDGRTYWLAGVDELAKFERDPVRYAPAMGGRCAVSLAEDGLEVNGVTRIAAIYRGRLYLFANAELRRRFQAAPKRYADQDLAIHGVCPVCRIEHEIEVEGLAEHRTTFQGLLYRFDSPEHRRLFLAAPQRYIQTP